MIPFTLETVLYSGAIGLVAIGTVGLVMCNHLFRMVLALVVAEAGANLLIVLSGFRGGAVAPIFGITEPTAPMVDPVPQVLVLTAIVFFVLILVPLLYALAGSFLVEGRLSPGNYLALLEMRQFVLFGRSLLLAGSTALVALLLGLPLAFLVQRTDLPGRNFFGIACLVPLIISPYINAAAWIQILGERGFLNLKLMVMVYNYDLLF